MKKFGYISLVKQATDDGHGHTWIQAFPYGTWFHPVHGEMVMTPEIAYQMKANFEANIFEHDLFIDYDHRQDPTKGKRAAGWIKAMDIRPDGLYWAIDWTPEARKHLDANEYRYFSPEWTDEWQHTKTGQTFHHVAIGGGLTNRPYLKGILPINASELVLEDNVAEDDKKGTEDKKAEPENRDDQPGTVPDDVDSGTETPQENPSTTRQPGAKEEDVDLSKLRSELGLAEDADMTAITAAVASLKTEKNKADEQLAPLKAANAYAIEEAKFASEYPELWKERQEEKKQIRTMKASEFATKYQKLPNGKGLSAKALDKVKEVYEKVDTRTFQASDLTELMDTIGSKDGMVDYRERGSDTGPGSDAVSDDPAKALASRIQHYQASDNLSYKAAFEHVAKAEPEVIQAYNDMYAQGGKR